jgi:hypothetical protein
MASPSLQAPNLGDLLATTLRELGDMRFTEIATDLQDHVAMRVLLKKNRVQFESGTSIQWDLMIKSNGSARNLGLYATDITNVQDVMIQANTDWRHTTANYSIDRRELKMNRTPRKIVDLLKTRRIACLIDMAELMEANFWNAPSATDGDTPYGIPYWVTKNATEGFNGGVLSGFTTVAGVSPTTYPRWQNWTYQYVAVSRDDFIRHARQAATKIFFRPPVDGIPTFNTGDTYGYFTNYAVIGQLEEAVESQNEDLGNDLASRDGQVIFRRMPVTYVPKLDADTTGPFYMLNFGLFKNFILKDEWLIETPIPIAPNQHTVSRQHVDCSYQFGTRDRRRHAVLATGTTYPG